MEETKHDSMLFEMLKECKTLPTFLDHIFGFLKRRTDFYIANEDPKGVVGLPPGLAKSIVEHSFMKHENKDSKTEPLANCTTNNKESESKIKARVVATKEKQNGSPINPAKCYNGADYEKYSWSQTYNEVDVYVKLPENIKAKDLSVNITSDTIKVTLKDGIVLLEGKMSQTCKYNEALWSIDKGELVIHLEKSKEIWYDCLFTFEPKLDVTKLECIKPLEDLPEDAQAKIAELQWNQEQKMKGLPTSEQLSSLNTLKKAWNAEGSPFSGPFDPSSVILN